MENGHVPTAIIVMNANILWNDIDLRYLPLVFLSRVDLVQVLHAKPVVVEKLNVMANNPVIIVQRMG